MIGTTLSHFKITAKLGEGGMGEVYRAEDTKLGREVAIKVLPEAVASDPERLARFEREAKVLASLNHANIAAIYSFERATAGTGYGRFKEDTEAAEEPLSPQAPTPPGPSVHFLVMELVEGEDLAERMAGGAIPTAEALPIAQQIAEALETAHENGIIHRDLKPANVKVTPEGQVKVLDFGLAKALDPQEFDTTSQALSMSPTLTAQMTEAGVLMGTAAYMSPEQARGQEADKRADIWAFGVVLWEMLSGRRLFAGPTVSDTLAEILKTDPDLDELPTSAPASIRRLLRRCLQREPKQRLRDIGDARLELAEAIEGSAEPDATSLVLPSRPRWIVGLAGLLLGLAAGAALFALFSQSEPTVTVENRSPRHSILAPAGELGTVTGFAISRDGSTVAVSSGRISDSPLVVRRLDSLELTPIPGTEGARNPFFSPDGEWVAFFDDDELRKVPVQGGASTVLCEARTASGGTWSEDGWIYFTHGETRLARVPSTGGSPEDLIEEAVFGPHALPGGRGLLAALNLVGVGPSRKDEATIALVTADGQYQVLIEEGYAPKYAPSGHLVFMRQGTLFGAPFDLERLEVTGEPVRVGPDVWTDSVWAEARYDLAADGTLIYLSGVDYAATVPTWIDRDGTEEKLSIPRNFHGTFQLSPDQSRLAIQVSEAQAQIHTYDFARDSLTRLSFEGSSWHPTWSQDGQELIYAGYREDGSTILRQRVDGIGEEDLVLTAEHRQLIDATTFDPYTVSPDGRHLLITTWGNLETGGDIWLLALDGKSDPQPLLKTPDNEIIPMFSPNGDYILYSSNKAGPYGIYVRPFPDVDRREWPISTDGGYDARWSPTGGEILYRVGPMKLMSVPYELEPEFTPGLEQLVLETDFHDSPGFSFDISLDGERILVNKPAVSLLDDRPVILVTDWFTELDKATQ
jgi:serine/threonine-protein kinase